MNRYSVLAETSDPEGGQRSNKRSKPNKAQRRAGRKRREAEARVEGRGEAEEQASPDLTFYTARSSLSDVDETFEIGLRLTEGEDGSLISHGDQDDGGVKLSIQAEPGEGIRNGIQNGSSGDTNLSTSSFTSGETILSDEELQFSGATGTPVFHGHVRSHAQARHGGRGGLRDDGESEVRESADLFGAERMQEIDGLPSDDRHSDAHYTHTPLHTCFPSQDLRQTLQELRDAQRRTQISVNRLFRGVGEILTVLNSLAGLLLPVRDATSTLQVILLIDISHDSSKLRQATMTFLAQ